MIPGNKIQLFVLKKLFWIQPKNFRYLDMKKIRIFTLIIGGVFLYAGVVKAIDIQAFAADIMAYGLTGYKTSFFIAATFPYIEILVGLFLIIGFQIKSSLFLVISMMFVFTGAIVFGLINGLEINCGCFSNSMDSSLWLSLMRNLLFLVCSCISFLKMESYNAKKK